jgi:hypothetical protein
VFPLFGKFATSINNTSGIGGKLAAGVVDTGGANLHKFVKKFEMTLMLLSEAWGKMIQEKNHKQKSRDTVPLTALLGLHWVKWVNVCIARNKGRSE